MINPEGELTLSMNNKELNFKVWLDQYEKGTISPADKAMLLEEVAQNRMDNLLNEELDAHWIKDIREVKGEAGPVPFEQSAVYDLIRPVQRLESPYRVSYRIRWWAAAAILLCVAGLLGVWKPWEKDNDLLARVPKGYSHQTNQTGVIQEVFLSDGSSVKLASGATIYYPERFKGAKREVYLKGNAFFEVTHMEASRFIVHGQAVSAEVLGTSFWVRQDETVGNAEVEVRSGRVSVKANGYSEEDVKVAPVVVTANQLVAYHLGEKDLKLTLADTLLPLHTPEVERILEDQHVLRFKKATRLGEVLSVLSKVYGVEIGLSTPDLNNCLVTGDLSGQDLIKSVEMICLSIGTTYEREQTRILISGYGCTLN